MRQAPWSTQKPPIRKGLSLDSQACIETQQDISVNSDRPKTSVWRRAVVGAVERIGGRATSARLADAVEPDLA
jgi:hypothetical protein